MKKALRWLLDFLDRKFPDRVTVTQKDYDLLNARIKILEGEVTKFNVTWGYAGATGNGPTVPAGPRGYQR